MRNKLFTIFVLLLLPNISFGQDASSAPTDSTAIIDSLLAVPHSGPLGINDETGLALFIIALLILLFGMFLLRKNIIARAQ
ncbi:MAG TPA: hypothetical protein VEW28_05495 [Candidatus Kapabacteria bacterium]|nr:hypothetical protein [Candidatus Kapabacteria bacterium]